MMSKKEVKSFAEGSVAKHHTIEWCPPCFGAMEENSAVCRAVADEYESNVPDDEKHVVSRTIHLPDIEYNRGGRVVDGGCKEERVVKAAKYRVKKTRHKESTTSTVNEGGTFLNANTRPQSGDTYYGRRASENSSSHASQTVYTNTHTKKDVCTNRSANRLDHRASRQAKCADTSTHKSAELSQGTASLTAHLGSSHQRQHGKKSIRPIEFLFDYHFRSSGKYDFNPEHLSSQYRTRRKQTQRKERYVQSRYRLIVSNSKDVKNNLSNPDANIPWDSILLAVLSYTEEPTCYICLSMPVFPNVSRCGHMFCCSCLFHYFTFHEDSRERSCPVCVMESIPLRDLRPVLLVRVRNYAPGDTITFQLLKRASRNTRVYKVDQGAHQTDAPNSLPLWEEEDSVFNRVMLTDKDLASLLEEEGQNIDRAIREMEASSDDGVIPYYVMAKEAFRLLTQHSSDDPSKTASSSTKHRFKQLPSCSLNQVDVSHAKTEEEKPYHFFYQCDDGQYIFLHKMCLSWLYKEYEKKESLPVKVEGRVVDIETHYQFYGKNGYLWHLPSNCVVKFALIEMDSVLKDDNLTGFNEEKRNFQKKKARQERLNRRRQQVRSPISYANSTSIAYLEDYDPPSIESESFPEISSSKKTTVPVNYDSDWIKVGPGPIISANRLSVTEEAFPALSKTLGSRTPPSEGVSHTGVFHGKSFYEAVCQKPNSEGQVRI
ncbi:RING finger protein 10-like isoform X1 [Schistocerca gregaria]|uniref:RING finger protein 10-like isoform X1 n=1 Tax=Schistocerca gregaria TaxID=7010 RepID=UPI00211E7DE1|nr:RING finger protein 10-like isoform X1 [Schistocerca gregaria]